MDMEGLHMGKGSAQVQPKSKELRLIYSLICYPPQKLFSLL